MSNFAIIILVYLMISQLAFAALDPPTELCINNVKCSEHIAPENSNFFPGTTINYYPGFIVANKKSDGIEGMTARWKKLFDDRHERFLEKGVYTGIMARMGGWKNFYKNELVRPDEPQNYQDPAYTWEHLENIFNMDIVKNRGVKVLIQLGEVGFGDRNAPLWLKNDFDGLFDAGPGGGSGMPRYTPKYYRSDIVQEVLYFWEALHEYVSANGHADKIMFITLSEFHVNTKYPPHDYDKTKFAYGVGKRQHTIAKIWAQSGVNVQVSSLSSSKRDIYWQYMDSPMLGATYPDMKMRGTDVYQKVGEWKGISGYTKRFVDMHNNYQLSKRPLSQATEGNGQRSHTYFSNYIANPWGYSNETKEQTTHHILWALSGEPKGTNKDSGFPGQPGKDPCGVMPVHNIMLDFERGWHDYSPTAQEWLDAIDTFGPDGTFAFPALPGDRCDIKVFL